MRIGINGFGRMGRLALRAAWGWPELEFTHVNEVAGGPEVAAHLLTFDSIHGRWGRHVDAHGQSIRIDGTEVGFSAHPSPGDVPWRDLGVEMVLECSGKFRTPALLAPYFKAGVRKVIVAAPVKEEITTIHDITNTQTVVDAPHKDLRRARANSLSLIPTTTGSATAISLIYPELKGKLNGLAVRVPLLNASLTDCVFEVERPTSVEEVNAMLKTAAEGPLNGILGYEERPLVSVDYKDDPRSAIIDALSTMVVDGTSVKILAWYDSEIGYVNRMVELGRKVVLSLR